MWWAMLYSTADGVGSDGGRSIPPLFRKEQMLGGILFVSGMCFAFCCVIYG